MTFFFSFMTFENKIIRLLKNLWLAKNISVIYDRSGTSEW